MNCFQATARLLRRLLWCFHHMEKRNAELQVYNLDRQTSGSPSCPSELIHRSLSFNSSPSFLGRKDLPPPLQSDAVHTCQVVEELLLVSWISEETVWNKKEISVSSSEDKKDLNDNRSTELTDSR